MKKTHIRVILVVLLLGIGLLGCEMPTKEVEEPADEAAVAESASPSDEVQVVKPVEAAELPDEKQRMDELLKMEEKAAKTEITAKNADEVADQLEAEIAADMN